MFKDFDEKAKFTSGYVILFYEGTVKEYNAYYSQEGGQEYFSRDVIKSDVVGLDALAMRILELKALRKQYRVSRFVPVSAEVETTVKLSLK